MADRLLLRAADQLRPATQGHATTTSSANARVNYWLGSHGAAVFPVPFSLIQHDSPGAPPPQPHRHEMFDLYYPTDHPGSSAAAMPVVLHPVRAVLAAHPRRGGAVRRSARLVLRHARLAARRGRPVTWSATSAAARRSGPSALRAAADRRGVNAALFWLLELRWLSALRSYLLRVQLVHAAVRRPRLQPPRRDRGAWNLRHNRLMTWILLHGEWDLNHHRHPEVSWYICRGCPPPDEPGRSLRPGNTGGCGWARGQRRSRRRSRCSELPLSVHQ